MQPSVPTGSPTAIAKGPLTDHWRRLLPGIGRQLWRYKLRSGLVILCARIYPEYRGISR